jgi:hypothetical protein
MEPGSLVLIVLIHGRIFRGDGVLFRKPITQIDQPAAVAAEGLALGSVRPWDWLAAMGAGYDFDV